MLPVIIHCSPVSELCSSTILHYTDVTGAVSGAGWISCFSTTVTMEMTIVVHVSPFNNTVDKSQQSIMSDNWCSLIVAKI